MLDRTPGVVLLALAALVVIPETSDAAHRHRRYRGHGYYGHSSFHLGYAPGYYPSIGVGYGYYPFSLGFLFHGGPKDPRGAVRFDVEPQRTEVYVDGYYAGVVDDFGKLRLEPGPHDITLYLDGHRVFEETVYSSAGSTVTIHHDMVPLEPGEPVPSRPGVPSSAMGPTATPAPRVSTSSDYGVLALRSQPGDAEVWIDGERWQFSGGGERLTLHLAAGSYTLELRKEGYEPFHTKVEIQPADTTALNVRLGVAAP